MAQANKAQATPSKKMLNNAIDHAESPPSEYWKRWAAHTSAPALPQALPQSNSVPTESKLALTSPPIESEPALPLAKDCPTRSSPSPQADVPYRVLIVEDDRSQALFAQSVLNGAGIQARVETSSAVSQAIQDYQPDLILMDLHMPELDGIRLTTLIREQPGHHLLPIVFLTGDPDPEKEFELLESGADDVLTKPVRPRHLIAAVSNRIRRIRQQLNQGGNGQQINQHNPETSLPRRDHVMRQLEQLIASQSTGYLLLLEIAGALTLRDHYGFTTFDRLMDRAGLRLAKICQPFLLARLSDSTFLILAKDVNHEECLALAQNLRQELSLHPFFVNDDESVRLRGCMGYTKFAGGISNAAAAIHCLEQATLQARLTNDGIQEFTAQPQLLSKEQPSILQGRLELAYQAIHAVHSQQTLQYHVVLRLRQPDGTLLPSSQIVPGAESIGRIVDFDQQIMDHALGLLDLHQQTTPPLRLFISQSIQTLLHENILDWLVHSVKSRHTLRDSLVIDIRAKDALNQFEALEKVASRLAPLGLLFCLSQYDNEEDIQGLTAKIPFSFARLAKSFEHIYTDISQQTHLRQLIQSAHRHNIQVIAKRLDDLQAASAMWASKVDFIEGSLVQSVSKELGVELHRTSQ